MYVYKIESENGKKYIGITNNFSRRMREHCSLHNPNSLIAKAINKHGKENFSYEVLKEVETVDEAKELEIHFIRKFNTLVPNGYNISIGGDILAGASNGRAHFTVDEIFDIRTRFNNDENYMSIYNDYQRVSVEQFIKILRNKTYLDCSLRCKDKTLLNQGSITKIKNNLCLFSEEEVVKLRLEWCNLVHYKKAYKKYSNRCSLEYFYQVYYGLVYKNIMPEVFSEEIKKKHSTLSHSGENNSRAKLTANLVAEIRERFKEESLSKAELGRMYGVTATTISDIINYKTWKM